MLLNSQIKAATTSIAELLSNSRTELSLPAKILRCCVLNAIKYLAGLPDSLPLLSDNVLESVGKLKKEVFRNRQISLSLNETLVALSVSGPANPAARMAMAMLPELDGCEMHTSHIPATGDDLGLRRLGIHLTSDPQFTSRNLFME